MSWGLWNKIKRGFKKVGSGLKKVGSGLKNGVNFVNDKIVKPFKPLVKTAANYFLPGAGELVDTVSDGIDSVNKGDWNSVINDASDIRSWAKGRFN